MKLFKWDKNARLGQLRGKIVGIQWSGVPVEWRGVKTKTPNYVIIAEIESVNFLLLRINVKRVIWANHEWHRNREWFDGMYGETLYILETPEEVEMFKFQAAL